MGRERTKTRERIITNRIEWVRHDARHGCDALSDHPGQEYVLVLYGHHSLRRVIGAEVRGAVDDDSLHRHPEASVQTAHTVRPGKRVIGKEIFFVYLSIFIEQNQTIITKINDM